MIWLDLIKPYLIWSDLISPDFLWPDLTDLILLDLTWLPLIWLDLILSDLTQFTLTGAELEEAVKSAAKAVHNNDYITEKVGYRGDKGNCIEWNKMEWDAVWLNSFYQIRYSLDFFTHFYARILCSHHIHTPHTTLSLSHTHTLQHHTHTHAPTNTLSLSHTHTPTLHHTPRSIRPSPR